MCFWVFLSSRHFGQGDKAKNRNNECFLDLVLTPTLVTTVVNNMMIIHSSKEWGLSFFPRQCLNTDTRLKICLIFRYEVSSRWDFHDLRFVHRCWVFIWTIGGWTAGWVWVCCFSMLFSCFAPSSLDRCKGLKVKSPPDRVTRWITPPLPHAFFLDAKKQQKQTTKNQIAVFMWDFLCTCVGLSTVMMSTNTRLLEGYCLFCTVLWSRSL